MLLAIVIFVYTSVMVNGYYTPKVWLSIKMIFKNFLNLTQHVSSVCNNV